MSLCQSVCRKSGFHMTTLLPSTYNDYSSLSCCPWPKENNYYLGVKGQGQVWVWRLHHFHTVTLLPLGRDNTFHVYNDLRRTPIVFCIQRSEVKVKRSVMITQEMCPIRTEISTYKNMGKCIYLLFVWLAVIVFRQNYFYILPNFGDFGAKMSFFHYIINQKLNNFIKHCPPPPKKPLISEMCIYIKSLLCKWGLGGGGGYDVL